MYKINNRRVKSADFILPAPVGGLNKRDPLVRMDLTDAIEMDNYMPTENSVELREGYERYVRLGDFSNTKKIETLACYNTAEHKKMIAVFDGKAFDVLTTTATQYQNVSFTKCRCQTVQYRGHLYFMNGVDKPKVYYIDDENIEHFENWGFEGEDLPENQIVSCGVSHEFL